MITENQATCTIKIDNGDNAHYTAHIGREYEGGYGCAAVDATLATVMTTPQAILIKGYGTDTVFYKNFNCQDDGNSATVLTWESNMGLGAEWSAALQKAYPDVGGFNCPDCGTGELCA